MSKRKKVHLSGIEIATMFNELPLEYACRVFNDPTASVERRDAMAIAALNYVHARYAVSSVEINRDQRRREEIRAELDQFIALVGEQAARHLNGDRRDLLGPPVINGEFTRKAH